MAAVNQTMFAFLRPLIIFLLAALCEISGAYLIWLWRRDGRPMWLTLLGAALLFLYGVVQTAQSFGFGRAFAAYGGVFIMTAALWGWWVDGRTPDRWDWAGIIICLFGAGIILWGPRR